MRRIVLVSFVLGMGVLALGQRASADDGGTAATACTWSCNGISKVLPNGDIECDGELTATGCDVTQTDAGTATVGHAEPLAASCAVSPRGLGRHR